MYFKELGGNDSFNGQFTAFRALEQLKSEGLQRFSSWGLKIKFGNTSRAMRHLIGLVNSQEERQVKAQMYM